MMNMKWVIATTKIILPSLVIYTLFGLAGGFFYPYQTLQARSLGLTVSEVLNINGIIPFISFFASPLIGYVGDKLGYKPTFIFTLVFSAVELVAFTLLPKYTTTPRFKIGVNTKNTSKITEGAILMFGMYATDPTYICPKELFLTIDNITCTGDDKPVNNRFSTAISNFLSTEVGHCNATDTDFCTYNMAAYDPANITYCDVNLNNMGNFITSGSSSTTWWSFLFVRFLWQFAMNPGWTIADSSAVTASKKAGIDWGVTCAIGTMLSVFSPLIVGFLINSITILNSLPDCITSLAGPQTYQMPFYSGAIICIILAIYVFFIRINDLEKNKTISLKDEFKWALKPAAVLFYAANFAYGIMFGISDGLVSFYLLDDLNISQKYYGILTTFQLVMANVYTFAGGVIHKKIGSMHVMILASVMAGLKLVIFSFVGRYEDDQIPYALFIASFESMTLLTVGNIGYIQIIVPKHLLATAMGISGIIQFTIARGLGSFLGAQLNDAIGIRSTIQLSGFAGLAYFAIHFIIYHCFIKGTEEYRDAAGEDDDQTNEAEAEKANQDQEPTPRKNVD